MILLVGSNALEASRFQLLGSRHRFFTYKTSTVPIRHFLRNDLLSGVFTEVPAVIPSPSCSVGSVKAWLALAATPFFFSGLG
jgi:hypothetical protein